MTPEPPKSPKPDEVKPTELDALIRFNGEMVENLFSLKVWNEIVFPLIKESIAGVSGDFRSGRYYHGSMTQNWKGENPVFVAGYQKALMDFYNHLHDFILAKDNLIKVKQLEQEEAKAPIYNPFLEVENDN